MAIPPGSSWSSTALTLPNVIRLVLPVSAFAAAVYVAQRQRADSELVVVQAQRNPPGGGAAGPGLRRGGGPGGIGSGVISGRPGQPARPVGTHRRDRAGRDGGAADARYVPPSGRRHHLRHPRHHGIGRAARHLPVRRPPTRPRHGLLRRPGDAGPQPGGAAAADVRRHGANPAQGGRSGSRGRQDVAYRLRRLRLRHRRHIRHARRRAPPPGRGWHARAAARAAHAVGRDGPASPRPGVRGARTLRAGRHGAGAAGDGTVGAAAGGPFAAGRGGRVAAAVLVVAVELVRNAVTGRDAATSPFSGWPMRPRCWLPPSPRCALQWRRDPAWSLGRSGRARPA